MKPFKKSGLKLPTALHLFVAQLFIIVLVETLVHFWMSSVIPDTQKALQGIADALLLVVVSAPFVWVFVGRPMHRVAVTEFSRSKAILESIVEAVITFNSDGVIESLNPTAETLFGYALDEIKGNNIALLIPAIETKTTSLRSSGIQTVGWRKDGVSVSLEVSVSNFNFGGCLSLVAIIHDCTERNRAEELIKEQKDFSFRLIQHSAVPCFVLAPDHSVMLWNRACEELTGLKSSEMIGSNKHWMGFYDDRRSTLADLIIDGKENEISDLYENFARSPFTEEGLQCEGWYTMLQGTKRRYLFFDAVPVRNARGELSAVIETFADITKRKIAEEALEISEEKFNKAFHSSPDGVFITRKADGRLIDANDTFIEMLGYAREEIISSSCVELGMWIDPSERDLIIERTEQEGAVRNVEIRGRIKSGEPRIFLWSSDLIIVHAEKCLIVTMRDITAQKENERQLLKSKAELTIKHEQLSFLFTQVETVKKEWEETMDCIDDMVILTNSSEKIKRCNRSVVSFTGKSYDELKQMSWREVIITPQVDVINQHGHTCEINHRPTGRWFYVNSYSVGGETSGDIVVTLHDLTEIKKVSDELAGAYNELKNTHMQLLQQEKLASIGQLAAGVAHEINNPIGFITSNLGTMNKYVDRLGGYLAVQQQAIEAVAPTEIREGLAQERKRLKVDYILQDAVNLLKESAEGAERVRVIVQNLKSFSRVDEDEWKLAQINDCLESAINIAWNEIKYKATMAREYTEIPQIWCYPQQLNQVFLNLLVNGAHAIETQGQITVRTWHEEENICIMIRDTGCGIPEEIRNRIFEPFFTTKEVGKGTGLGLSISYDIIKKHNGSIELESELGKGTAFIIKLPAVLEQDNHA